LINQALLGCLDNIIDRLSTPLPEAEVQQGWTEQARDAMRAFFLQMRSDAAALKDLKSIPYYVSVVRGLDHWGIAGGELLEAAAKIGSLVRKA
jgi:hypothetical protein